MDVFPMSFKQPVDSVAEHHGYIYGIVREFERPITKNYRQQRRVGLSCDAVGSMIGEAFVVWRQGFGIRQKDSPSELLLNFLNLREGDRDAALEFIRHHGLFDQKDAEFPKRVSECRRFQGRQQSAIQKIEGPSGLMLEFSNMGPTSAAVPQRIREYWRAAEQAGKRPFATRLSDIWSEQRMLKFLWNLAEAIERKDWRFVKLAYSHRETLPPSSGPNARNAGEWLYVGRAWLYNELSLKSSAMKGTILLSIGDISNASTPYIATIGVRAALHMALICELSNKTAVGRCEQCSKLFIVSRSSKRFCDARCQAVAKVHRYRARK